MDKELIKKYCTELLHQCDNSIIAYDNLKAFTKSYEEGEDNFRADKKRLSLDDDDYNHKFKALFDEYKISFESKRQNIFYHIQGFLTSTGNISKIIWNDNSEKLKGRSAAIRDHLKIDNTSLLKSRSIRNSFEHFDERLDQFIKSNSGVYIDSNIGRGDSGFVGSELTKNAYRNFHTTSFELRYLNEIYNFPLIAEEVEKLRAKLI